MGVLVRRCRRLELALITLKVLHTTTYRFNEHVRLLPRSGGRNWPWHPGCRGWSRRLWGLRARLLRARLRAGLLCARLLRRPLSLSPPILLPVLSARATLFGRGNLCHRPFPLNARSSAHSIAMARLRACDPVNCIGPGAPHPGSPADSCRRSTSRKTDKTCARELKARARGGSIGSTSNPEATDSSRQRHGHRRPRAKTIPRLPLCYLAIRQTSSTTAAPTSAATTDVTSPTPSASMAM
jgi:hypothetical protein